MKTITKEEIKRKLAKHYSGSTEEHMELRDLYQVQNEDNHGCLGSVFFSLTGSPPKGYAIYIPGHRLLSLYDRYGKRFRIIREVKVEGIDRY